MFKRPRLSAQTFPVNAALAGFLLFYAASCSGPQEQAADNADTAEMPDTAVVEEDAEIAADTLPAVWMTRELDLPVRSVGIAGGAGSHFAVAYEGGGLQIFNFDGERVTQIADLDVKALDTGRYALLSGTPVTFYPGIDAAGDLSIYIHGGGLAEAVQYDLQGDATGPAAGLCASPPAGQGGILHRLAYWSEATPSVLRVGAIVEQDGELAWQSVENVSTDTPITACVFTDEGPQTFSAPVVEASVLKRMGRETIVTLDSDGEVSTVYKDEDARPYDILDGITVVAPDRPHALASTGDARGGGYPGGLIILGGEIAPDDARVVLVDPSKITLTPISVPPAGQ